MRDVMKAADPAEVAHRWESAMEGADIVGAATESVSATVPATVAAGMTAAVSSPVPSAAVTAATASGRDGRCESRRDKRARDGGCDGYFSKHGAVSSSDIHPHNANAGG